MIGPGHIPMNAEEEEAVFKLLVANDGAAASLTRNEPGESGAVRVEVTGVGTWLVDAKGKAVKQRG